VRRLTAIICLLASASAGGYDPLSVGGEWLINVYKRVISPLQGTGVCNFTPTCSQYTRGAIRAHGFGPGVMMGADRLMRCNNCAWTYLGSYYHGIENNRIIDPVDRHVTWHDPAPAAAPAHIHSSQLPSDIRQPAANTARLSDTAPALPTLFADRLYESGALREAATEYLRLRFTSPWPPLQAYAGLMAGETYLAASRPAEARLAFATVKMPAAVDLAAYGTARALFAEGRYADVRLTLDSAAPFRAARPARMLYAWSLFRENRFAAGAGIATGFADDSLAGAIGRLDGTGIPHRDRLLATALSAVLPGTGQCYSGRAGDGIYAFITVAGLGLAAGYYALNPDKDPDRIKLGIFGAMTTLFHAGNIYGANIAARDYNLARQRSYLARADSLFAEADLVPDYDFLLAAPRPAPEPESVPGQAR